MRRIVFLLAMIVFLVPSGTVAYGQNQQQLLNQYVAELQKNPSDQALREKIIRLSLQMKPPPAVPEEAERYMARGAAAFKAATSKEGYKAAVAEFEKAILAAPWLAEAYNNLGIAQDKAGLYENAIQNLQWYLLAAPNTSDQKIIKNLIYEIEYKKDNLKYDNTIYAKTFKTNDRSETWQIEIKGQDVTLKRIIHYWNGWRPEPNPPVGEWVIWAKGTLEYNKFKLHKTYNLSAASDYGNVWWIISEDGEYISLKGEYGDDVYKKVQ